MSKRRRSLHSHTKTKGYLRAAQLEYYQVFPNNYGDIPHVNTQILYMHTVNSNRIIIRALSTIASIAVIVALSACGGGGGGSNATTPPVVESAALAVSTSNGGTIVSTPSGISCGTNCSVSYDTGTVVTLTATPATGYSFYGWSGACTGTTATCAVTMSTTKSVAASFTAAAEVQQETLTVTPNTQGTFTSSPSGINCGSSCSADYSSGTVVTLTEAPSAGYTFTGWSGACSGTASTCAVTMSSAQSVSATYAATVVNYTLSVTDAGTGQGTVTSSVGGISCATGTCSASILSGTSVTLTATPGTDYGFTGWTGACSGTALTCTVSMSAAQSVTASFFPYTLSVTDAGTGSGTVTSNPSGISCSAGTCSALFAQNASVVLTASPSTGSVFTGWSGACSGSTTTCTVALSAAKTVTATFGPATVASSGTCANTAGTSTALATIVSNASDAYTTNTVLNGACPTDTAYGQVNGICYGSYAVQVNAYGKPPASTNFSMWSNNASCWGFTVTEPTDPNNVFWNAPEATRGFSFAFNGLLTSSGGISVSALNTQYASTSVHCPSTGTSGSVCAKWTMSVPGVAAQSQTNTVSATYSRWDALMDIYFHSTAKPAVQTNATFDLQIYQMVMDNVNSGVPNWASYIVGTHTTKTIGGITYLVSVNMGDPGTEGSAWVGNGGSYNSISMFPLPTYPTGTAGGGTGSYLWGMASAVHDIGGIISWLSQPQTINGVTGIFDDAGNLLKDNARANANVTTALLSPSFYLSGLNPGYEVVQATPSTSYPNNAAFTTTNFWVAVPGETVGN